MAGTAYPFASLVSSMVTRGRRALASAVVVAAVGILVAAPESARAAATADGPKKVGTEQILLDVKPRTPAQPAAPKPDGPTASPGEEAHRGDEGLPPAVARMRKRLLDAAYSGELQRLKIVMQSNEMPPVLSINEIGDPLEFLKTQSGDGQGLELLAILTDVLEAPWIRSKPGTPQEMYVWPAFAAMPIDKLEPPQLVEIYKILTSSDFEEMKGAGKYTFYSVGIGPDGTWHWFKPSD